MKPDQLHNRIRTSNKKQKAPTIGEKLKSFMSNMSVDVFGYEKTVTKNITRYFEKTSQEDRIPIAHLFIRIFSDEATIRVFLHRNGKLLREVPVKSLVDFFAGEGTSQLLGIEKKVISSVSKYMDEFAKANEMTLKALNVLISSTGKDVTIGAYADNQHSQDIPLVELIKYFKQ